MITTVSLVTICTHTSCYNITDHIPYAVYYIPVTYYITGGLNLLIPFTSFARSPSTLVSSGNHLCVF